MDAPVAAYSPAVVAAFDLTLEDSLGSFPWLSVDVAVAAQGEEKPALDAGVEGLGILAVFDSDPASEPFLASAPAEPTPVECLERSGTVVAVWQLILSDVL